MLLSVSQDVTIQGGLDMSSQEPSSVLEVASRHPMPVIGPAHPGLAGNKYGFEGGTFLRLGDDYHLFTAEMWGDPFWAAMRFGHWRSRDLVSWVRVGTLLESKGAGYERDRKFSTWSPMPVYNEKEGRWNLFYVAYRGPLTADEGHHMAGVVIRAVAQVPGLEGIGGPYEDADIVLQPDARSQAWEGQQGTASFYPYRTSSGWHSFYCSHNYHPISNWPAGLVCAPSLEGPWERLPEEINPSTIEKDFIENPIVYEIDGQFWAVYDAAEVRQGNQYVPDPWYIGYSTSNDGIHWPPGRRLAVLEDDDSNWAEDVRTPLGMVAVENGNYAMLFTAKERGRQFWSVGLLEVTIKEP